jgi:catechol 2,3-dioxygenase-like lactoylglutathione lyase family enzyme
MDYKFELVIIPVTDVDRAKAFYEDRLRFHLDVDHAAGEAFRVVQFTPPGSACSVSFGRGLGSDAPPGSAQGMHLVVIDIAAAHAELSGRGVEMGPLHHFVDGEQRPGVDPDHADFNTFARFTDPDGNGWVLQERDHGTG